MGILLKIAALPVTGPLKGIMWIAQQVQDRAENELFNPAKIQSELMELELSLDLGEITEETYMEAEEVLLQRLRMAQERQMGG
jgi:hypothetical protein